MRPGARRSGKVISPRLAPVLAALLVVSAAAGARGQSSLTAPCLATDLRVRSFFQGATSSLLGGVSVRNTAQLPCSLGGRPKVRVVRSDGRAISLRTDPGSLPSDWKRVVVLRPGRQATAAMQWWNYCGVRFRGVFRFALKLTTGTHISAGVRGSPTCITPHKRSSLSVSYFRRVPQ